MRVFNFSAGPAALPEEVLRQAADEMLDWHGSGMGVMEMSHRGPEFMQIHSEALLDLRELMQVPASHQILFLQGGGIGENAIVPLNLFGTKPRADFVITGSWSQKSQKEALKYGAAHIAATGRTEAGFTHSPPKSEWQLSDDPAYVHLCTNETIDGVETFEIPDLGDIPLVADASSHILSRPMDIAKYGVLYGGAVRLAVPRLPAAVMKQISSTVKICIGDIEREDGPALNAHAVALFDMYVEHCGNAALKKVCRDVTDGLAYSLRVPNIVQVLNWAAMSDSLVALEQATRDRDPIRAELAAEALHELPGERPLSPERAGS